MKKNERYIYPAVFSYSEEDQEIAVLFPDLNCATSGVDEKDAFLSARELLGCVLYGLEEDGEIIPVPTPLADIKLDINEKSALIDVYMPSIRMANNNSYITKSVTLPAWLNAVGQEHNINFSQILQEGLRKKLGV